MEDIGNKLISKIIESRHKNLTIEIDRKGTDLYINSNSLIVAFNQLQEEYSGDEKIKELLNELCVSFQVIKGNYLKEKLYEGRNPPTK